MKEKIFNYIENGVYFVIALIIALFILIFSIVIFVLTVISYSFLYIVNMSLDGLMILIYKITDNQEIMNIVYTFKEKLDNFVKNFDKG